MVHGGTLLLLFSLITANALISPSWPKCMRESMSYLCENNQPSFIPAYICEIDQAHK